MLGKPLDRKLDGFLDEARDQGARLTGWIESKLEGWLGLEINREKTRVVNRKEAGASLDFLRRDDFSHAASGLVVGAYSKAER